MSLRVLRCALIAVGTLVVSGLVGCSTQRPLEVVKADGEFAYEHGQYDKAMVYLAPSAPHGPADQLKAPELVEAAARK